MKYTIKYQKDGRICSKKIEVSQTLEFEEVLKEFTNIIDIKEHNKEHSKIGIKNRKKEIFLFFKQLDLMLQSHLSLHDALDLILKSNKNKDIKNIITLLKSAVIQNISIDSALKEYKNIIGELPIVFLNQGIQNGTINHSINSIVTLLEKEIETQAQIKEKLRYPVFLILALFASIAIIFIQVVPNFESIFNSLGDNLPVATEILLFINNIVNQYWFIVLGVIFFIVFLSIIFMKKYKYYFDTLVFKDILFMSDTIKDYQLYKLFLALSIMVQSKYKFQIAINNSIQTITNLYLLESMKEINKGIENGKDISDSFEEFRFFDQVVIKLLHTAQNTGQYEIVLSDITNYYKGSFEEKLKKLTAMIEPLMVSIIAMVVLWLVLAIMVPIWELSAVGL